MGHGDGSGRAGRACLGLENGTWNGRVECESCGRRAWKRCLFSPLPQGRRPGTALHLSAPPLIVLPSWASIPDDEGKERGHRKTAFPPQISSSWPFFGGVAEEGRSEGPPLVHIPAFSGLRYWSDPPRAQSEKYVPRAVKLFIEPL